MKVLMVDVDGVLIHGRPADGLPLFTFLERDLGLSVELLQREFFQVHWGEIIVGREALEPRLAQVLARIAPHLSAATLIDYWFENDPASTAISWKNSSRFDTAVSRSSWRPTRSIGGHVT